MAYIKKISEQKYLIRVSKGTGKDRRWVNITFRGTLAKAREHAREKETQLDQGQTPEQITLTFEKYLVKWLKAVQPKLATRTHDDYKQYIERYASGLNDLHLSEIKPYHVQSIYDSMRHLSPTTVRNLHAALRACFSHAVKKEYIFKNPCTHVDLPKKIKKEKVVLTFEEAATFIQTCREFKNGLIFEFALETGMRPEEYLALRWKDIDFKLNRVSVRQAVSFNRSGGGFRFVPTKTVGSERSYGITEELRSLLMDHKRHQNEAILASKVQYQNHDLVFANEIGTPYPVQNLSRRYLKPILDKCDFGKHLTLYSLRHSCATLLLMLGENPKVVAERLGHSSITLTLDTYSHVLPHIQDAATAKLNSILRTKCT